MDECIERETLLDKLNGIRTAYQRGFDFEAEEVMDRVVEMVKKEPTADVRPERHGEWRFIDKCFYECSECGAVNDRVAGQIYCWKCGAKMDGKGGDKL